MKRLILFAVIGSLLAGCATTDSPPVNTSPPATSGPASVADRTTLDERSATLINLSYTAAARSAALLIQTGIVKDRATIARIGALDNRAKAALDAVNLAYTAGNSQTYGAALDAAQSAVASLVSAVGNKP